MKTTIRILSALVALIMLLTVSAIAEENPEMFLTCGNAAQDGDTIELLRGTSGETVTVAKSVTITGASDGSGKPAFALTNTTITVNGATVELAAIAVGTEPDKICKTLSFILKDGTPVLILVSGEAKIANPKYKAFFHEKAKMIPGDQVESLIGHDIGGVCPFGINDGVKVYLDVSLKKHEMVWPAVGSENSAIGLTIEELENVSGYIEWIDVCKEPEAE